MRRAAVFVMLAGFLVLAGTAEAKRLHHEEEYQRSWCEAQRGEMEVILANGARVDCVTAYFAVEFDFADKWAESLGQALCYADGTGLEPGIVLIVEPDVSEKNERDYLARLRAAIRASRRDVKVWIVRRP